ncbi:hypothetical protein AB0N07_43600 [Streptomyces sp. NPDC051172]|uniref:hypothetical protein n=1 Tax=Streptomyces sp. NPDC051172 TaxID=3155796 RepID=UPI0034497E9B
MSLVVFSTISDTGNGERRPHFDQHKIVAATLVQQPRYADVADERWDDRLDSRRRRSAPPLTNVEALGLQEVRSDGVVYRQPLHETVCPPRRPAICGAP